MKRNVHEVQVWRSPLHVASESCAENSEGGAVCVCGGGVPPVLMMGLLFTRKCLLLDNLDKNVTASLHVLQIHGIKPLEQLMESSLHTSHLVKQEGSRLPRGHSPTAGTAAPGDTAEPLWLGPDSALTHSHTSFSFKGKLCFQMATSHGKLVSWVSPSPPMAGETPGSDTEFVSLYF